MGIKVSIQGFRVYTILLFILLFLGPFMLFQIFILEVAYLVWAVFDLLLWIFTLIDTFCF